MDKLTVRNKLNIVIPSDLNEVNANQGRGGGRLLKYFPLHIFALC